LANYNPVASECDSTADEFRGKVLLVMMKDLTHVDSGDLTTISFLAKGLEGKVAVYGMTNSSERVRASILTQSGISFCVTGQDMDMIKTCVNTNVAFVLLNNGIVQAKWTGASIPTPEEVIAASN
jgi:hypothetical protein